MKDLKGTKTEANLQAAFAGESQARNKYTYYASKAKKDGYVQIGKIFEETANNEKEHAKIWFKLLHGGEMPDTPANLLDAAEGERKASMRSQSFSRRLQLLRRCMRSVTASFLLMLKAVSYSHATRI